MLKLISLDLSFSVQLVPWFSPATNIKKKYMREIKSQ